MQLVEHVGGHRRIGGRAVCRFNDLSDPASIPRGTDYSSVFESDVPIIVQHTRLDSRQAEAALLSTMAYADVAGPSLEVRGILTVC